MKNLLNAQNLALIAVIIEWALFVWSVSKKYVLNAVFCFLIASAWTAIFIYYLV